MIRLLLLVLLLPQVHTQLSINSPLKSLHFQTINNKLIYGNPPTLLPNFDVAFQTSKTDANYEYSLSANSLQIVSDSKKRYTMLLRVLQNKKRVDGMCISVDTKSSTNLISRLTVSCLIVDSSLKVLIRITHFNYISPSPQGTQYYRYRQIQNTIALPRKLQGRYELVAMVSGVDIKSKWGNLTGFATRYVLINSTHIQTVFYHEIQHIFSGYQCYAHQFIIDIIMINLINRNMKYIFNQSDNLQIGSPCTYNSFYHPDIAALSPTNLKQTVSLTNFPSASNQKQVFYLILGYQYRNLSNVGMNHTPSISFNLDTTSSSNQSLTMTVDVSSPNQHIKINHFNIFDIYQCIRGYQWNKTTQQCVLCPSGQLFSTHYKPQCMQCQSTFCSLCNGTVCLDCQSPFILNRFNDCVASCVLVSNCSSCYANGDKLVCLECNEGFRLNRYQNKCYLYGLRPRQTCLIKKEDRNEFEYTFRLVPKLQIYRYIEWKQQFQVKLQDGYGYYYEDQKYFGRYLQSWSQQKAISSGPSTIKMKNNLVNIMQAYYNHQSDRFFIKLNYSQRIGNNFFALNLNLSNTIFTLRFPRPRNHLSIAAFTSQHYQTAAAVKYLSIAVAIFSLAIFVRGYLGDKLAALQSVSVVQLAALLTTTPYRAVPCVYQLRNLSIVLGFTHFGDADYQNSKYPSSINIVTTNPNVFAYVNLFLIVIFGPFLVALVFKILLKTKYKYNQTLQNGWRYALGSYTYYGLLFLSYGICSFLGINLRYFTDSLSCYLSLVTGAIFVVLLLVYVIMSNHFQVWFGQFKTNFWGSAGARHVYTIQTVERVLTPIIIMCPGQGLVAVTCSVIIFTCQVIFFAVKKPHIGGERGPILRKIAHILICLQFVMLFLFDKPSSIAIEIVPICILITLNAVLIISLLDLGKDNKSNKKQPKKMKKEDRSKEIQMKMNLQNKYRFNQIKQQLETIPIDNYKSLRDQLIPRKTRQQQQNQKIMNVQDRQRYNTNNKLFGSSPTNMHNSIKQQFIQRQIEDKRQVQEDMGWKPIVVGYNRIEGDKGLWQEENGLCSLKQLNALKARLRKQYKNESEKLKKQEFIVKTWHIIEFTQDKD